MTIHTDTRLRTTSIFADIDAHRLVAHGRHVRSMEVRRLCQLALDRLRVLTGRQTGGDQCTVSSH